MVTLSLLHLTLPQIKVSPNISINHFDLRPVILLVQRGNMGRNMMFNVNPIPMYIQSIFTSTVDPYP